MFKKLFGGLVDSNEREVRRLEPLVEKINNLEAQFEKLSDDALKAKTAEFKERMAEATAQVRQDLDQARDELAKARQCEARPLDELEREGITREGLSTQCRGLEERIAETDKELFQVEKKALEDLLPEAFAAVRESAKRTIHQRHFDVQLIGGMVLHHGKIAEMRTGEGKTLVATLPLYLNSLTGRGCHLVTVNDYLARRDPYWMGPIFHALGVTVASIYPQQATGENQPARMYDPTYDSGDNNWKHFRPITRKEAYQADIAYGTSAEFGFDYLRDNMVIDLAQCVQRSLCYAIVDEVDNLLIDEARTPLIISGPAEESGDLYKAVDNVVSRMKVKVFAHEPITEAEKEEREAAKDEFDYFAYEKTRAVEDNPRGQEKLARAFGMRVEDLFGGESVEEHHQLSFEDTKKRNDILSIYRKSMTASSLYKKDRDYVVKDGEIIIVDEFTGRLMMGRRYSEGLHQAIEAKEGVKVQREMLTFATITIQNFFRMYAKLAGMTGTALTEAEEFNKIYKLEVVEIPTNKPMVREDSTDRIFKDENAKFNAVVREIEEMNRKGQPVLVGTVSIEKSERLGDSLKRKGISFQILNAKNHEKEATIIAEAGKPGGVTVATNMAGRGVDIVLGGKEPKSEDYADPKEFEKAHKEWEDRHNRVLALGGLHVVGTERHEARRIDNQLRGRSGRQGDPGSTRFYVALDDDVVRHFGGDRVKGFMEWAGMDENTPIENSLVSKSIENAQVKTEGFHFDMRKHLVEYDDVVNKHRELVYCERRKILSGADLRANIQSMVEKELKALISQYMGNRPNDEWDVPPFLNEINVIMPLPGDFNSEKVSQMHPQDIEKELIELSRKLYDQKEQELGITDMRLLERMVMLRIVDSLWVEHLTEMENKRQQASLNTLQQMKAVDSYKRLGFTQFQLLLDTIQHDTARTIFHVKIRREEEKEISTPVSKAANRPNESRKQPVKVGGEKVGRNDPCPCGSGKKYKKCCGK
jgi:preprotein translocase subunit SecA